MASSGFITYVCTSIDIVTWGDKEYALIFYPVPELLVGHPGIVPEVLDQVFIPPPPGVL